MLTEYINMGVQVLIAYATEYLIPFMVISFVIAALLRKIIYFTVRCEGGFTFEFEKRVHKYLADPSYEHGTKNFHTLTQRLLNRTFEEYYNLKKMFRRRRFDQITCITDRIFMIPEGSKRLMMDTLSQTKYLRKEGRPPKFIDIAKWAFESNPVFNRVLGIFPMGVFHDILNILPGLFVIGGIFGTFLGVMQALPMLSEMNITDVESTKTIMDAFLLKMAFSMGTSVVGIILSVAMTMLNAVMNPDNIYFKMINKYASAIEFLWNDTTTNVIDMDDMTGASDRRAIAFTNRSGLGEKVSEKEKVSSQILEKSMDAQALEKQASYPSEPAVLDEDEQRLETVQKPEVNEAISPEEESDGMDEEVAKGEGGLGEKEESLVNDFQSAFVPVEDSIEKEVLKQDVEEQVSEEPEEKELNNQKVFVDQEDQEEQEEQQEQQDDESSVELPSSEVKETEETEGLWASDEIEKVSHDETEEQAEVLEEENETPQAKEEEAFAPSESPVLKEVSQVDEVFKRMNAALSDVESDVGFQFADKLEKLDEIDEDLAGPIESQGVDQLSEKEIQEKMKAQAPVDPKKIKEIEDKLSVLKIRLVKLDQYIEKAEQDRMSGEMSEEMWKDETNRYAEEKEKIQEEIEVLEDEEHVAA